MIIFPKGDNNNTEDSPISKETVIGEVVFIIHDIAVYKKVFSDIQVILPLSITIIIFIVLVCYKEKNEKSK